MIWVIVQDFNLSGVTLEQGAAGERRLGLREEVSDEYSCRELTSPLWNTRLHPTPGAHLGSDHTPPSQVTLGFLPVVTPQMVSQGAAKSEAS